VALVLLAYARTHSPTTAGGIVAAMALPQLLSGPAMGAWLDRTRHKRRAFLVNQLLLIVVLLGLLALVGRAPTGLVLMLASVAGLTSPVISGGFTGLIAPLVPSPLLPRAYGAETASYYVAAAVGPAVAAAVAGAVSAQAAVGVCVGLSAVAALAISRVPMPAGATAPVQHLAAMVFAGVRQLAAVPALRSATIATTLTFAGAGAFPVVFPAFVTRLGARPALAGALLAAFAVGALLGSVVMASRTPRSQPLVLVVVGTTCMGLVLLAVSASPSLPLAAMGVLIAGVAEGPIASATFMVRETCSPAHLRTQVLTSAASIKYGAYAGGSAIAGHVVAADGARAAMVFLASCSLSGAALAVVTLRRSAGRSPSGAGAASR
jgi:predicted MFS family arabinose efflux permease